MAFRRRTAIMITILLLALGIALIWWTGGTARAFPHLLYVPILFAAIELDILGGVAAAVVASLSIAWLPIAVATREPQTLLTIGVHAAAYMTAAVSTGAVVHYLRVQQVRIQNSFVESVAGLVNALEAADDCTAGHSVRVSELCVALGEELGLKASQIEVLRVGGMLHDLGKVAVPQHVLNKPGKLSWEELNLIRVHPAEGDRILSAFSHARIQEIRDIVRHHHERLDGSGYPDGLAGAAQSLLIRIVAVADVYDAVTSPRPYRKSMTWDEAMAMLDAEVAIGRLDGQVVRCLHRLGRQGRLPRKAVLSDLDLITAGTIADMA